MKFGLYSSIASPPRGEHLDRAIDEVIAEAQLAEACGFDSCFFGEHHQDRDGFLPSPLIVCTAVAARTRTLKVGTSVILLPLHHPVRVAEDVITLDLVSKGRVILGVGIGYQPADFSAFAVPMEERLARFEEGVQILRHCWTGEPFSFRGKHYTLEDVTIRPRPYQRPGPPLWIGGGIPAAARRAGRIADGFVGTPSTGLENATRLIEAYKEAAHEAGRPEHADGHYRDALALAEELGMRPLVAHCHLGLGKLSRRTGKLQEAQEHLTTAVTLYRDMDMRFWLEQAEAELRHHV